MAKFLKNKIYAGLANSGKSISVLSEEIYSTPRTLFRRLADTGTMRIWELCAIGISLGWTPTEFGRLMAYEYEQEVRAKGEKR